MVARVLYNSPVLLKFQLYILNALWSILTEAKCVRIPSYTIL